MLTFREMLIKQERMQRAAPQQIRIEELKTKLSESDYKVIKCSEYALAEQAAPYDIAELHNERQAIRDEINELETQIAAIEAEIV